MPIMIDSSPIKGPVTKTLPKPRVNHPFFAPREATRKRKEPQNPRNPKPCWPAPYPDRNSQHVRGPQTLFPVSQSVSLPKGSTSDRGNSQIVDEASYSFLLPGLYLSCAPSRTDIIHPQHLEGELSIRQYASAIPTEHIARHPSISRMVDRSISGTLLQSPGGRALVEKWRPRCAEEVLGNEANAHFLRNWLRALELQLEDPGPSAASADWSAKGRDKVLQVAARSRKRPRLITEVAHPRRRKRVKADSDDEDDNWIVYDDDDEDDYSSSYFTSDLDIDTLPSSSSSPMHSTSSLPDTGYESAPTPLIDVPHDLGELHNTILLVGPPGSGKTASVYACAEELNWEVFEVYPGIGKRSGYNIENLVGEVGKNHLVRQRPHGSHDFVPFSSPSKLKRKQGLKSWLKSDPDVESDRGGVPQLVESEIEDSDRPPSFANSLILLEEVDILFKEDHRFWETVKGIIRECRRPIICTCNGK